MGKNYALVKRRSTLGPASLPGPVELDSLRKRDCTQLGCSGTLIPENSRKTDGLRYSVWRCSQCGWWSSGLHSRTGQG